MGNNKYFCIMKDFSSSSDMRRRTLDIASGVASLEERCFTDDSFETLLACNSIDFYSDLDCLTFGGSYKSADVKINPVNSRKSFIKKNEKTNMHSKSDPLSLLNSYKKNWSRLKLPGYESHKQLRWKVRDMMLSDKNDYEKSCEKSNQLKWIIRMMNCHFRI